MRQRVYEKLAEAVEARRYMKVAQEMEDRSERRRSALRTFLHDTGVGTIAGGLTMGTMGALAALGAMRANSRLSRGLGGTGPSFADYARGMGRAALTSGTAGAMMGGIVGAGVGAGRAATGGV